MKHYALNNQEEHHRYFWCNVGGRTTGTLYEIYRPSVVVVEEGEPSWLHKYMSALLPIPAERHLKRPLGV